MSGECMPVVPAVWGEWFWLPRFRGTCETCGRTELLSISGRCRDCEIQARAAAKRNGGRR